MLQRQAVSSQLLELLSSIMQETIFDSFVLVGGTSLALQIGHRVSVDLDFFGQSDIDEGLFLEKLALFGNVQVIKKSANILICSVNGIKVDFVNYRYPWIDEFVVEQSMRLASIKEIAAMKLNAIAGRGSKKDFIDLYYLLQKYNLSQLLDFYKVKYQDGSDFMVLKSLSYFDDADLEQTPLIFQDITWDDIKAEIIVQVRAVS
jgi:predicted nucleotidyltransferase component of viral defense system